MNRLKGFLRFVTDRDSFIFYVALFFGIVVSNCAAAQTAAKTALEASLVACSEEHADVIDVKALQQICPFDEALAPLVEQMLAAKKKGLAAHDAKASAARGACAPVGDAGK